MVSITPLRSSIVLALLLLSACVSKPLTPIENLQRYQQQLADIEHWRFSGKLIMRSAAESEKARVSWQNLSATDFKIRLSGTLGVGTTYIYGDRDVVRLEQSGKEAVTAATPEQLVYEQLGRDIPISHLRFWVRGLPAPDALSHNISLADSGHLSGFEQSGWQLSFSDYRLVDGWRLPGKLEASRDDLSLTLSIASWTIEPTIGSAL
ncbi:lipoprotein insertase outer membrane protein LolB [Aurantivibrio plasticivorans]